jgi:putative oxidoreductase
LAVLGSEHDALEGAMTDLALLVLRLVTGGLLAGHGAQKAFGAFGGPGFAGVAGWLESLGLRPGTAWAGAAVSGELGGGALTALGLFNPLGPILQASAMAMAWAKGHAGKPIWAASGGAELPLTNIAAATAVALAGPGKYSLDRLFGIRVPGWITALAILGGLGSLAVGMMVEPEPPAEMSEGSPA